MASSVAPLFARQYAMFYDQLGRLLKAGLPAERALANIVSSSPVSGQLRAVAEDLHKRVGAGQGISDGLARHPQIFPRHEARFLQAAEQAGKLPAACESLSVVHKRRHERAMRVATQLVYPIMIISLACLIAPFKLAFDGRYGAYMAVAGIPILTIAAALGLAVWLAFAPVAAAARAAVYAFASRVPPVSGALRQLAVARAGQLMALCFEAGLAADQVLKLVAESTPDRALAKAFLGAAAAVSRGQGLAAAMEAQGSAIPSLMIAVVRTGEESGKVDEALGKAGEFWQEDADRAVDMLIRMATGVLLAMAFFFIAMLILSHGFAILSTVNQLQLQ